MISLTLPFPPSSNRLWRAVNGRNIVSKPYRAWKAEAHTAIRKQVWGTLDCGYALTLEADRPDRRRRDLANLEKAVSDALVSANVITDDCNAEQITLRWTDRKPGKGAAVHVRVEPA